MLICLPYEKTWLIGTRGELTRLLNILGELGFATISFVRQRVFI